VKSCVDNALAELEAPAIDPDALARVGHRIAASRRVSGSRRTSRYALVALAAAAAAALVALHFGSQWTTRGVAPLRLADSSTWSEIVADRGQRSVRFEDTSRVVLSAGTRIRAQINDGRYLVIAQSSGRVAYDVHPGGPREWSVRVEDVRVDVVGTAFTVAQHDRVVDVRVTRGHVVVTSPRLTPHRRDLYSGNALRVGEPAQPGSDVASTPQSAVVARTRPAIPPLRAAPGTAWRELAARGQWNAAFEAIGDSRFSGRVDAAQRVEDLLLLADTARLSGHPALAVEPLSRIVEQYSGDRRAALAAFTLGRVQQEQLMDARAAAQAFESAIRLGVTGDLLEGARARRVEACSAARDRPCVDDAAHDYLAHHPDGPNAARVRRWLE